MLSQVRLHFPVFRIASAALAIACVSLAKPVVVSQHGPQPRVLDVARLQMLPPQLFYEEANTEKRVWPESEESQRVTGVLVEETERVLVDRGFSLVNPGELDPEERAAVERVAEELRSQADTLFKPRRRLALLRDTVGSLEEIEDADALVCIFLKVKVGRPGSYDPAFTGSIYPRTSTSHVLIAVTDLEQGEVVWLNEVFFRSKPDSYVLSKSVEMALSTFPERQNGGTSR